MTKRTQDIIIAAAIANPELLAGKKANLAIRIVSPVQPRSVAQRLSSAYRNNARPMR